MDNDRDLADPAMDSSGISLERKRRDDEAAWFNELYLLAPVGYFVVGFDSKILLANLVGAGMLGISRANPGAHRFRSFIGAASMAEFDGFIGRALNSHTPETCRISMRRASGADEFAVTLLASADGSGQACRVVVEHAEGQLAALERSEERFRRIVHSAGEGIWEIDAAANTTFVNPKMAAILGYSIEEMLARPLASFMDTEGLAILEENLARRREGIAERHEFKFVRRDGSDVWTTMATNPIFDGAGTYVGALALVTDITDRRASTELIWHQANFDELTGLPNRHMFMDRLRQEVKKADRGAAFLALVSLDLDHFKEVNDRHGHAGGDAVLVQMQERLREVFRESDYLIRWGGEEFLVLARATHRDEAKVVAERIRNAVAGREFVLPDGTRILKTCSIGFACFPFLPAAPRVLNWSEVVELADQGLYLAKRFGRNAWAAVYGTDQTRPEGLFPRLMHHLDQALADGEVRLVTSLETLPVPAGPKKRRLGLAAGKVNT